MDILEYGEKIVEFLGQTLGNNCEIVLQDIEKGCIRAIANGHVSGRQVGAPLTDLTLKMAAEGEWKHLDYQCNYTGLKKDGHLLRSSTFFLKENDVLRGMICINVDDSKYEELSRQILMLGGTGKQTVMLPTAGEEKDSAPAIEKFSENIHDVVHNVVSEVMRQYGNIPMSRLTQDEKLEIIQKLNEQGIFLIKGAIFEVAEELECSEASVYRYLAKINKSK